MILASRSEWGARPPAGPLTYVAPIARSEHFTHWNGPTLPLGDHASCLRAVKAMQDYHIDSRGWADIGYNALVCPHGVAILGRGLDYAGAHCLNHNTSAYGVQVMIGAGQHPTPAALATARDLWAHLCARSGHALTRLGHRDGMQTDCPGDELYAWVHAGMPITTPTPEGEPVTPAEIEAIAARVAAAVWDRRVTRQGYPAGNPAIQELADSVTIGRRAETKLDALPTAVATAVAAAVVDAITARYDVALTLAPKETAAP